MKLNIEINCENAAFEPEPGVECARILRKLADRLEKHVRDYRLADYNGNVVGFAEVIANWTP
jgi:hypothetical protein